MSIRFKTVVRKKCEVAMQIAMQGGAKDVSTTGKHANAFKLGTEEELRCGDSGRHSSPCRTHRRQVRLALHYVVRR